MTDTIPFCGGRTAAEPAVELTTRGKTKILVRWPDHDVVTDFADFSSVIEPVMRVLLEAQCRVGMICADIEESES